MVLSPIGPLQGGERTGSAGMAGKSGGVDNLSGQNFKTFLLNSLQQVNQMQLESDAAQEALATGRTEDISMVMSTVEKADIAFNTLMAVRNKLVDSYQEVLRMSI